MTSDGPPGACWTCKVRRKKCDRGDGPACENCRVLRIPCHRGVKPEWMNGGIEQAKMAERLKREVRTKSHQRLERREAQGEATTSRADERALPTPSASPNRSCTATLDRTGCPSSELTASVCDYVPNPSSEAVHLAFYLDSVLPFLLPFYSPGYRRDGGRAWILEFTSSSPLFRRVALCQSSYFFALTHGTTSAEWDAILTKTKDLFGILRHAIETISNSGVQSAPAWRRAYSFYHHADATLRDLPDELPELSSPP